MPDGLLTLDLATRTGWAYWSGRGAVAHGTFTMPRNEASVGFFLHKYELALSDLLTLHDPRGVIFEAPWVGDNTSQDTARKLLGLACLTEFICYRREVRLVREVNNQRVRSHFIGIGRGKDREALKVQTMRACRMRGWAPRNDDEADALAVLDYACHLLKMPMPWRDKGLLKATL